MKQARVIKLCTRRETAQPTVERLGVCRPPLYNWKNKLLDHEVPVSMKRHNSPASLPEQAELERRVESLRRDIRQPQLEHGILEKENGLLKKGLGVDPQLLSNREKTMLVGALRQTYFPPDLLAALSLVRSCYFYHRARSLVADKYCDAYGVIKDVFELNCRCYGYRRMRAALGRQQVFSSEKVVRRLMKQEGLTAATT